MVKLTNVAAACGGSLKVTGTGFGLGKSGLEENKITIKATAPQFADPEHSTTTVKTTAVKGNFSVSIPYWYGFHPPGPACFKKVKPVTVVITGSEGNSVTGTIHLGGNYCAYWGPTNCI